MSKLQIDFKDFQRPQQYIGNEWNVIRKPAAGKIKICLSYPDIYEVGMSNLGLRIIYGLLNEFPDVICERVFLPAKDFAHFLERSQTKLFSLETKTSLNEFDVIGFNLDYELNFTNFLYILHLSGIPLVPQERNNIVIAGGIANPEPLADFIDVFCLGEFEAVANQFIQALRASSTKEGRLNALSEIDGLYVPSFYEAVFQNSRYELINRSSHAKPAIKRVFVDKFDAAYYPKKWLTPHTKIIHDRVPIEIARGCPQGCFFCQARALYRPYRERRALTISSLIEDIYKNSGYENFSLLALSASDHSQIEEITTNFINAFGNKKVGLSLPSLRIDDIVGRLYNKLFSLKKTSLTVAVEAGSDSLRGAVNKKIDINKLLEAAQIIRSLKLTHLKVYFMFGLPQETEDDLLAIGEFLDELSRKVKIAINASINIFCPKPFSVWEGMAPDSEDILLAKRQLLVRNILANKKIKFSISQVKRSIVEALISRAGRNFAPILYRAYLGGAIYQSDSENFSWQIWQEAMRQENFDYHFYLEAKTENFPWSFIGR